jgi:NAD(P)-dependent dehydrogenase (short-subunit alcohol dehydrogenase family)
MGKRSAAAGVQSMFERGSPSRLGTPREIADFVAFLASPRLVRDRSVFVVDGGQPRS